MWNKNIIEFRVRKYLVEKKLLWILSPQKLLRFCFNYQSDHKHTLKKASYSPLSWNWSNHKQINALHTMKPSLSLSKWKPAMNYAYFEIKWNYRAQASAAINTFCATIHNYTSEKISREKSKTHEISLAAVIMAELCIIITNVSNFFFSLHFRFSWNFTIESSRIVDRVIHVTFVREEFVCTPQREFHFIWYDRTTVDRHKSARVSMRTTKHTAWILIKRNWQIGQHQMIETTTRQ